MENAGNVANVESGAMPADDEQGAQASAAPTAAAEPVPATPESPVAAPAMVAGASAPARELTGVVTSNKADKTVTVRVDRRVKHPVYGKFVRRSTKLAVHDERNDCREGDTVTIIETRPISKTKSWRLGAVVERAGA